ncbi:MAG: glycoside hydrolase family 2 protein [Bacteroidota bacterium]
MNRLKHVLFLLFLLSPLYINGQSELITNIDTRSKISLNGKWRYHIDAFDQMDCYKDNVPEKRWDIHEYNFPTADWLYVPGDWNSQRKILFLYEGHVFYRKKINYNKKTDKRVFLYFGAANYKAEVYLNGELIGTHEGGFTPFNIEVTDKINNGKNSIVVNVENYRKPDRIPAMSTDWWNYGGLTRDVFIVETNKTFIRDYYVQLKNGNKNLIKGWVKLDGDDLRQKITLNIPELTIHQEIKTDKNGYAGFEITANNIELWSPDNPKLYNVVIEAKDTKIKDQIGFRTIETKGTDILLNGNPIFLRGICIHEESPVREGRAWSEEDAEILLKWAKELNCNYVRLAHYPHNEHMVKMADKMGILVWEELPIYWGIDWEDTAAYNIAEQQLKEMITRDKNRASIIIWSMANETGNEPPRNKFLKNLISTSRSMDNTRLISAALLINHKESDKTTKVVDDELGNLADVISVNAYYGWYQGLPDLIDKINWDIRFDKPFMFSEIGGGALQGYHGDTLTRWSEEYQAYVYEESVEMFSRIPRLKGVSPWLLVDFRSPRRLFPYIQDFYNRKGLISDRGEKKKAFYILKEYYQSIMNKK